MTDTKNLAPKVNVDGDRDHLIATLEGIDQSVWGSWAIRDAIAVLRSETPSPQPSLMGSPLNICDKDGGGE